MFECIRIWAKMYIVSLTRLLLVPRKIHPPQRGGFCTLLHSNNGTQNPKISPGFERTPGEERIRYIV